MSRISSHGYCTGTLSPSPLVRRFASRIAAASAGKPLLDVACGSGRNAAVFFQLGCDVICVDKDLASFQAHRLRIQNTSLVKTAAQMRLHQMDLVSDAWPFSACTFGGIINVHFLRPALFQHFESSLSPGAYLLLETVPGCGGNYLELPKTGEVRLAFEAAFEIEFYKERMVGPHGCNSTTVQMVAKKRSPSCI